MITILTTKEKYSLFLPAKPNRKLQREICFTFMPIYFSLNAKTVIICAVFHFFSFFLSTAKRNQDWKKWMDKSRILDLCVIIMVTMLLHWLYLMLNICLLHFRSCIKSKTFDNYVTNEEQLKRSIKHNIIFDQYAPPPK